MDAVTNVMQAQQAALANQINMTLLGKSLNIAKMQGDAMVQLIADAATIGQPTPQAQTPGLGQCCDIQG